MVRNSAFLFIKPHAVTEKVKELVKQVLDKNDIVIKKEGQLDAEDIDKYKKIDKHYYAIASKATILTPDKLNIPTEKFKDKFGVEWNDVLQDGRALNAMDACSKFEIDANALDQMWATAKTDGQLVKFGGGFYCGKLEPEGKGAYYVFNGFFMTMRSKFVEPGASIYYYVVEWEADNLPWADFRGDVLGPTDPSSASKESLRGAILDRWKELGLKSEPNTGDNGVHASASPFEGLAERVNWLGYRVERDPFGKLLLKTGVSASTVRDWCKDPQVTFGPVPMTKSLFDSLEDTDSDWCLALCQMIAGECVPQKPVDLEAEIAQLKAQIEAYKPLEKAVLAIQQHVPPVAFRKDKSEKASRSEASAAQADEQTEKTEGSRRGRRSRRGRDRRHEGEVEVEPKGKSSPKGGGKSKGKSYEYEEEYEKPPLRRRNRGRSGGGGGGSSGKGGSKGGGKGGGGGDNGGKGKGKSSSKGGSGKGKY